VQSCVIFGGASPRIALRLWVPCYEWHLFLDIADDDIEDVDDIAHVDDIADVDDQACLMLYAIYLARFCCAHKGSEDVEVRSRLTSARHLRLVLNVTLDMNASIWSTTPKVGAAHEKPAGSGGESGGEWSSSPSPSSHSCNITQPKGRGARGSRGAKGVLGARNARKVLGSRLGCINATVVNDTVVKATVVDGTVVKATAARQQGGRGQIAKTCRGPMP